MAVFESIAKLTDDPQELFRQLGRHLVEAGDFHRLFDLRLMQRRHELGLPVEPHTSLEELDSQLTTQLELSYLEACREIGQLFLEAGSPLEAWRYLRPTGEKNAMRRWLACAVPDESNADGLIELALHEGIDPERGYAWLLARRGTCQAVTELEAMQPHLSLQHQTACAAVLVRHMHEELLANLKSFLKHQSIPYRESDSFADLLADHGKLVAEAAMLVDSSHLAAAVRFARLLTDPALLQMAVELADYGQGLPEDYQYPDQPPFEELYATHRLLFRAIQGHEVGEAIDYFGNRARQSREDLHSTTAIETYLVLLQRLGRTGQALDEYAALVPTDMVLSPAAPSLMSLAQGEGNWQRYLEICTDRQDIISFAAGMLTRADVEKQ